jgi:hypothetical protein
MESGPKTLLDAAAVIVWAFWRLEKRYQCSNRHPKRQFSIKVGTILEDSPIGLDKWLPVMW